MRLRSMRATFTRAEKIAGAPPLILKTAATTILLSRVAPAVVCDPSAPDYLNRLSLADLANTEVSSVSKSAEPLSNAPATIYVITHDQILRSGATNVIEAWRLAPNLLVSQPGSSGYVISARGLGGDTVAQNFSNKLLLLIDGRNVYSPLCSGIYAHAQDVLLEDVDRIEVISGAAATRWGANLLTRWQHHTDGTDVEAQACYDQFERFAPIGAGAFVLNTYDVGVQQRVRGNSRGLTLANGFVRNTVSLGTAWAAGSGAIRSPTPFDEDVVEKSGNSIAPTPGPEFKPDRVSANEIGYRALSEASVSFSISGFYHHHTDLRTVESAVDTEFLPLRWANTLRGDTVGLEGWVDWQVNDGWRLSMGLASLHKQLKFSVGASSLLGVAQAGDDPNAHATRGMLPT